MMAKLQKKKSLSRGKLQMLGSFRGAGQYGRTTAEAVRNLERFGFTISLAKASILRKRLQSEGLIASLAEIDVPSGIGSRYILTPDGENAVKYSLEELERLHTLLKSSGYAAANRGVSA